MTQPELRFKGIVQMMKSAVTISLVSQARGGPFIFWDDLAGSMRRAAELGFDAVELFLPGPDAVAAITVRELVQETGLRIAAVGTGAGMVMHQLSLTSPDLSVRQRAIDFVEKMIRFGGQFGAPAIIGSMQGRWSVDHSQSICFDLLGAALRALSEISAEYQVPLIYEPLNRYETNLCNSLSSGVRLLEQYSLDNVVLLADLFHMNIEEASLPDALRAAGRHVGHLHFVDSNRRPASCGHIDFSAVASVLEEIGYAGYVSAEALPWPDPDAAAMCTIQTYRKFFR